MYYRLDCDLNFNCGSVSQLENFGETLMNGAPVDESTLVLPWPFTLAIGAGQKLQLSDYYSADNLMSRRLVDAITASGVDNLQVFPASITREDTAEVLDNYCVVNVLGLVAAADMKKSRARPLANLKFFEQLAIDTTRAQGLLMFRLAESITDIIVAENVARAIDAGQFTDVTLEPVS